MGAFFLSRRQSTDDQRLATARNNLSQQGFSHIRDLSNARFHVLYGRKINLENDTVFVQDADNFCLSSGTLLYRQRLGAGAMELLFSDFAAGQLALDQLYGNFALLICHNGNVRIYNDAQGVYPLWHDQSLNSISSSFHAVASQQASLSVNPDAVYEYVFQEAVFGGETVFQEIRRLKVKQAISFDPDGHFIEGLETGRYTDPGLPIEEYLQQSHTVLNRQFEAIANCFGNDIDSALSGGYDSRLLLALCREQQLTPALHVYGKADSADVVVAKTICTGEGIPLKHEDKASFEKITPEQFTDIVATNLSQFQGACADGILDNGSDLQTRRSRSSGGKLLLNGGGGEVLRNFYYLPDRQYSIRQLLWSFYSRFDPACTTQAFSEEQYYRHLGDKVAALVGSNDKLERDQLEYSYAGFRCTYWMGHNNSINNQFGWFLTPYVDEQASRPAQAIPIRYKNYGLFQGQLIAAVDARLANYPSDYGYRFTDAVTWKRKLKAQTTLLRPPLLRRYLYRVKKQSRQHWSYFLAPDFIDAILPHGFAYIRQFFDIEKVQDEQQFKRICTLEYLYQSYNAGQG
ncbi:MAG: hypothetical protein PVG66_09530 [Chromatiales bacterium]|jgi:asparagine synthase (glutamine-hydrolysing)